MKLSKVILLVIIAASVPQYAHAADWQVRRATMSGACSLQPSDSEPPLGDLLATAATKLDACTVARNLATDDASDSSKCFGFTPNTRSLCHNAGIDLPANS